MSPVAPMSTPRKDARHGSLDRAVQRAEHFFVGQQGDGQLIPRKIDPTVLNRPAC